MGLLACGAVILAGLELVGAQTKKPEVYLWQRQWTEAVVASMEKVKAEVETVQVLAAEMNWRAGRLEIFRAKPDFAALKRTRMRVGLVVRVGPYAGSFSRDDSVADQLASLVRERVKTAQEGGVEPAEVQIDFDCAETKLAGYREWLIALREAVGTRRLVFTALPAWLKHENDFCALAKLADGFVLQVHSLEKPRAVDEPVVLCDPARAREWAKKASMAGVPFRVALPTYGYEVGFSPEGIFFGLAAEGPRRSWPEGTQIRTVLAEVETMRGLAREFVEDAPPFCEGVIWFRLPIEGDRLNWDVRTLLAVMRGEEAQARLVANVVWSAGETGLAEVFLENTGEKTVPLPARVRASWPDGVRVSALDALSGYALKSSVAEGETVFARDSASRTAALPPGRRVRLGWMRFPHEIPLQIKIIAEPPAG
ncbi:MAG: DUF3142 domain-containing protein [Nibricoccus sp.]